MDTSSAERAESEKKETDSAMSEHAPRSLVGDQTTRQAIPNASKRRRRPYALALVAVCALLFASWSCNAFAALWPGLRNPNDMSIGDAAEFLAMPWVPESQLDTCEQIISSRIEEGLRALEARRNAAGEPRTRTTIRLEAIRDRVDRILE